MSTKYKLRQINKHFCEEEHGGRRGVVPNPFELCKQRCIQEAGRVALELPYSPYCCYQYDDEYPQIMAWTEALTRKNPPHDRGFKVDPQRFRALVEPLDFAKPFDAAVAEAIWAEFRAETGDRQQPDAEAIAAEELAG